MVLYFFVGVAFFLAIGIRADDSTHMYKSGEPVEVFANKMGPFDNPLETYAYFELPVCPPASKEHRFPSLGQALVGDELFLMNVTARFGEVLPGDQPLCSLTVDERVASQWTEMVRQQYWYQMYADGLPMWATFGKISDTGSAQVFSHQSFKFGYNGQQIVFANLTVSKLRSFQPGDRLSFTYDVTFVEMKQISFDDRFRRYLDNAFFEHRIHWFSIFNSFMMVLFLGGLVLVVLSRTLKADYARFAREREELESGGSAEWTDESGWKQLANDVFRAPVHAAWLAALTGTGWQLVALCSSIILFSIASLVYTTPGSVLTYGVLAYAVTSFVGGYASATVFGEFASTSASLGTQWIRAMLYTALGFPGFVLTLGFLLNFVAIGYDSAQAIPFGGMVVMLLLWALVSMPLVVIGTLVGRHRRGSRSASRDITVNQIPRVIPRRPWYLSWRAFALAGGILPFGSIFIELYFVFTSFWNYKLYYVYGFMLLVFVILLSSTACVAVVSTYFLLNGEDHHWHWPSFCFGASSSIYVFIYAVYFYCFRTKMSGLFMFSYYFGYMGMMCTGLALLCGAVSYTAVSAFVFRIYRGVKAD